MLAYCQHDFLETPVARPLPDADGSPSHWRELRRFLLAALALTALYLGIQSIWMWGASQLGQRGWTLNDPALAYAAAAAEIAERSRQREAALDPHFAERVFRLGFEYGYLSQWLGGYGKQPDAVMQELSRPVAAHRRRLDELAAQLGVTPVDRLPVRTAADFSGLTQRIEDDPAGVAGRIEAAGSLRLRHLFLFAAHAGTETAALESLGDLTPIPAAQLIGMHATLAGVPEPLWRPLTRVSGGARETMHRDYQAAVSKVDTWLTGETAQKQ